MRYPVAILVLILIISTGLMGQSPDVYWGLNWDLNPAQVDSIFKSVATEKKAATKTIFTESRQIKGFVYRVETGGVEKVYVWYHSEGLIHSIEVVYRFEYPYDAQAFLTAYLAKYERNFSSLPQGYQNDDGTMIYLRIVEQPPSGKLGNSVYLVTMQSPREPNVSEESTDFIY